ncbi:MAG: redoxin family protein [Fimbriimonadaceae bacterium]|nr:redoxin family protein [Fimbriimonadaceae bacterium]
MQAFARVLAAALTLVVAATSFASGGELAPGSKAPSISVKKWVKGKEVTSFEPGKTYVVEFWATWCGPCIQSIPHLTEIAHKHKDVTFLGVSIWEDDSKVQEFVDKMGDKMDYNVAYGGNKEGMAETWMAAAGQNGIPTAFVVKDGVVRWIGHPMSLEKPLDEILAGTFDDAKFAAEFNKAAEESRKEMAARRAVAEADKLHAAGKVAEAKAALDKAEKENGSSDEIDFTRTKWLATDDPKAFKEAVDKMVADKDEEKRTRVFILALNLSEDKKCEKAAREAMTAGLKANKDDFIAHYYGSMFYFQLKDGKAGLPVVNRALELIEKTEYKDNEQLVKTLKTWKEKFASMSSGN